MLLGSEGIIILFGISPWSVVLSCPIFTFVALIVIPPGPAGVMGGGTYSFNGQLIPLENIWSKALAALRAIGINIILIIPGTRAHAHQRPGMCAL